MNTQPMNWEQWHTQVVNRMQAIVQRWGKADTYDYETLRKAEVLAMRELRKERANGQGN